MTKHACKGPTGNWPQHHVNVVTWSPHYTKAFRQTCSNFCQARQWFAQTTVKHSVQAEQFCTNSKSFEITITRRSWTNKQGRIVMAGASMVQEVQARSSRRPVGLVGRSDVWSSSCSSLVNPPPSRCNPFGRWELINLPSLAKLDCGAAWLSWSSCATSTSKRCMCTYFAMQRTKGQQPEYIVRRRCTYGNAGRRNIQKPRAHVNNACWPPRFRNDRSPWRTWQRGLRPPPTKWVVKGKPLLSTLIEGGTNGNSHKGALHRPFRLSYTLSWSLLGNHKDSSNLQKPASPQPKSAWTWCRSDSLHLVQEFSMYGLS